MLKERKVLQQEYKVVKGKITEGFGDYILGWYSYLSDGINRDIAIENDETQKQINEEEYFFTEFEASEAVLTDEDDVFDSVQGVFLTFNLNILNTLKYFDIDYGKHFFKEKEFLNQIENIFKRYNLIQKENDHEISIQKKGYLRVILLDRKLDENTLACTNEILDFIRNYQEEKNIHITRMFGSYILIANVSGNLKAITATNVPIEYCPLMYNLLKEVGGSSSLQLISALKNRNKIEQRNAMCELINEVVIKGGYFDTNRPLNSCEANVLFGASETIFSAFKSNLIDASVIVSNNLGTIITTNAESTQGAVKRMTGLFYTSPSKTIENTAQQEGIIPVFPYTAEIDQLEGVKKAIALGYKRIAVSVAGSDNYLHKELANLERDGIVIYKFGLCSTGISHETAMIMKEYADVVWSCASKEVKEYIEPNAVLQVGVKIPVHVMTKKGGEIIKNHLQYMYKENNEKIELAMGEDKNVILNEHGQMRILKKKEVLKCNDCPLPCI